MSQSEIDRMWIRLLFIGAFSILLAHGGDIFDVTTIYDIGSLSSTSAGIKGRVHARTNAIGLPLYNSQDKSADPLVIQPSNLNCDLQDICSWNITSWDFTIVNMGHELIQGKAYEIKKKQFINFLKLDSDHKVYLYITIGSGNIRLENILFVLSINKSGISTIYEDLYKSYENHRYDSIDYYDSYYSRPQVEYCSDCFQLTDRDGNVIKNINYRQHEITPFNYENEILTLKIKSGKLQLFTDLACQKIIREWAIQEKDSNNIFFTLSGTSSGDQSHSVVPVLMGSRNLSEIISPLFSPDNGEVCLAIVVRGLQSTEEDVIDIYAEDANQDQHYLTSIKSVKDYFQVKHFNIQLKKNISTPIKIVLRHTGFGNVYIERIHSCSTEGEEEVVLPTFYPESSYYTRIDILRSTLPTYNAYLLDSTMILTKNPNCLNGAVSTSEGCACRPGFTGDHCEKGCGKNQFGQDCLGLCSLHEQECKGLLLCTNITGCHCAPGYSGDLCNITCSSLTYGNDCSEKCGECLQSAPCDIYTGMCNGGCQPGYHPPYCKQEYAYYNSKPLLSSNDYGALTVSFNPRKEIKGYGNPELYQIQYREKGKQWLIHCTRSLPSNESSPVETDETLTEDITALKDGVVYETKILLMDNNFNKYDGHLVKVVDILTECDIPGSYDYKVNSSSTATSVSFSWTYINNSSHWCPVEGYEIFWKDDWKWISTFVKDNYYELTKIEPNSKIKFKIRAKTTGGYAPISKIVKSSPQSKGKSFVTNLRVLSAQSTSVSISWDPLVESVGKPLEYTITYKCVEQPACYPGCQNSTEGLLVREDTSVTLGSLLPYAQYLVTVTPKDGIKSIIYVGTSKLSPTETPKLSSTPPQKTNTSITVFWEEVPVCSSFQQGYNYQLAKKKDSSKILSSGFTKDTKISFQNLTASTEYVVKIFIVTVAGWNADSFLSVEVSTCATVPDAVRDLEIYKRGRNMLGLRWAEPLALYGQLKSFAVSHSLGHNVTTQTVTPTPCVAWPHLYCHTIEGLKTGRRYNVTVSARNAEVEENGEQLLVSGITKEGLPTAPENLKELNKSSTSVAVQWGYPNLTNGVLRSFVISVEETEKYDQDSCCQVYPLVETPVGEESQLYDSEVSGLHPAATYFVSVSAKTIGMGPSQSLVIHTRPPHLPFTSEPQTELGVTWLPQQQLPEVNNSDIYTSLIKASFLIAVFNDTSSLPAGISESGVLDPQLESLLNQTLNMPFVFVMEYHPVGLFELFLDTTEVESTWGQAPTSYESHGDNQLVAVQVTEYNGVYNVDLRYSVTKQ